jgi:pimeloyl-ACP methyl ester carboxylesterase
MSYITPLNLLLIAIFGLVLLWFLRKPMTARVRRDAPGEFARLSNGLVHYKWHGLIDGPILVMVHGLTTPSFVWRDQLPALTQAGFRVLTFDHFGRGFSDRPYARHNMAFFVREMDELLEVLNVHKGYHLLGYSMGGGIVTHYASVRRDLVSRLILVAPVGLRKGTPNWMVRWPIIGDIAFFLLGGSALRRGSKNSAKSEGVDAEMIALQCRETRFSGYGAAVLSSLRNVIYIDQSKEHQILVPNFDS